MLPSAQILESVRHNPYLWGYGHIALFTSIAGTGAGLHVAAYVLEHEAARFHPGSQSRRSRSLWRSSCRWP